MEGLTLYIDILTEQQRLVVYVHKTFFSRNSESSVFLCLFLLTVVLEADRPRVFFTKCLKACNHSDSKKHNRWATSGKNLYVEMYGLDFLHNIPCRPMSILILFYTNSKSCCTLSSLVNRVAKGVNSPRLALENV